MLVVAGLLYLFIFLVWPLLLPFFLALALAVLIDRPVRALEARRVPRSLAILLSLTSLLGLTAVLLTYGLATLSLELAQLSRTLPDLWEGLLSTTRELERIIELFNERAPADLESFLEQQREALLRTLLAWTGQLLDLVRHWAFQGIPSLFVTFMITGVATYLMHRDKESILAFLPRLVPAHWRGQVVTVTEAFVGSALGFVNALIILVSITTVITFTGLSLLGSPFAVLIAVLTGVLDLIPVLGPGLLFLPWMLYHFVLGDPGFGLRLALLYGVLTVVRTVLEPRIIGSRIGVHPLSTLIALYVGLKLLGMAGFVVGPMVAILLRSLVRAGLFGFEGDEPPGERGSPGSLHRPRQLP